MDIETKEAFLFPGSAFSDECSQNVNVLFIIPLRKYKITGKSNISRELWNLSYQGGQNPGSFKKHGSEWYNIADNKWFPRPSTGRPKGSLAGATLQNKIFAIGGGNGSESFSEVEMLDLYLGRWIMTQSMIEKAPGNGKDALVATTTVADANGVKISEIVTSTPEQNA
ncbi:hypothetical protein AgCh_029410 [Apium graveolens]